MNLIIAASTQEESLMAAEVLRRIHNKGMFFSFFLDFGIKIFESHVYKSKNNHFVFKV